MKHIISLGAGVQSSTMALMAAHGELTPMPDFAVFADTGSEPRSVYDWLDWLEKHLPFQIHRVGKGDLAVASTAIRISKKGNAYQRGGIPAFVRSGKGKMGSARRHCTRDFKINPILSFVGKARKRQPVTQWIGISSDERQRQRLSRKAWCTHRWPLIELSMTRGHCLEWMLAHGYPQPPRSACVFCPYHSDAEWDRLKRREPLAFAQAVAFEGEYQAAFAKTRYRGVPYLHRSGVPLAQVELAVNDKQAAFAFGMQNECEGMCGV